MANALIASEFGAVVGSFLHTAGAIAYLGGLALFVSWARHLRQGQAQPRVLMWGTLLTYVAIIANLLGGFMRTYQPGHPTLTQFGSEPWAAIMVAKHLVLFVGMGLAAYLFEVAAPRMRKAAREGTLAELPTARTNLAAIVVAASIIIASVFGAWSTVVDIGAPSTDDGDPDGDGDGPIIESTEGWTSSTSGTATATPTTGTFNLVDGMVKLEVVLSPVGPENPVYQPDINPTPFTLSVTAPDDSVQTAAHQPADLVVEPGVPPTARYPPISVVQDQPLAGDWGWSVTATGPAALYTLIIYVHGPEGVTLTDVVVLGDDFYEINLEMNEGDAFDYNWTILEDHPAYFDIHTHFDGEVQYLLQGEYISLNGTYVAGRTGGHSLLWERSHPSDTTLSFTMRGNFTIHSIVGP